jgi:hypothetical protein
VLAGPRLRNEKGERRSSVNHPDAGDFDCPKAMAEKIKKRGKRRLEVMLNQIKTVLNVRIVRHSNKSRRGKFIFYHKNIM